MAFAMLSRVSIRTILNSVFVTLAVALCVALLVQIDAAWDRVGQARRISVLGVADRAVFEAMTTLRLRRGDIQTAALALDNPVANVNELHAGSAARFKEAVDSARRADVAGSRDLIAAAQSRWTQAEGLWRDIEALVAKPKAERDLKLSLPWYNTMGQVSEDLNKLSVAIASEARISDPAVAEFIAVRQAAWTFRDYSGRECAAMRLAVS
ncbi:MAG TPA: hypothetical protein VGB82_11930, partial [Alphaproteobacteria bacterium]